MPKASRAKKEVEISYLDNLDPNLAVKWHYAVKAMWIVLAAIFGLIGYNLYALGISELGSAQGKMLGISFTLKDAGPGLIVMIFALVSAVAGVMRSKLILKKSGAEMLSATASRPKLDQSMGDQSKSDQSSTRFRLFRDFIRRLAREPSAYAILNSEGVVDIESMAWSEVPPSVREAAARLTLKLISSDKIQDARNLVVDSCTLHICIITVNSARWGMVSVEPALHDGELQSKIAREETRPLCHWD